MELLAPILDTTRPATGSPMIEPAEVIRRRAAEGWRFCQVYVPPNNSGLTRPIQVIFERPATGPQDARQQPAI